MSYETHNDSELDCNGTCLQGYADATYDALVAAFGEPTTGDEYKVDWEWVVRFDDGTVATVYNWKNGPNYCGPVAGKKATQITDWHIGGNDPRAITLVGGVLACQTQSNEERMAENYPSKGGEA